MAKKKLMRILGGYITHLSLCPAGANNIQTIYKSKDGQDKELVLSVLSKDMTELGEIYSVVYAPELIDLQDDLADSEVIKSLAYSFAKSGEGIDVVHNEKVLPKESIYIAESFIIQKGDPRFAGIKNYEGKEVDPTGGWGVVLKVEDPKLRELYRTGQWQGISMGGMVVKREESSLSRAVKIKPLCNGEDSEMTAEEMKALQDGIVNGVTQANKTLVESLAPAIAESVTKAIKPEKKEDSKPDEAIAKAKEEWMKNYPNPILPANPTEAHLAHFEKCVRVIEIAKTVDPTNLNDILAFHKAKKAIMEGKEVETTLLKASSSADPWQFSQVSNQTPDNTKETEVGPNVISFKAKSTDELSDKELEALLKSVPEKDVTAKVG